MEVRAREARGLPLTENVRVVIALHPPDRRRRDLDNALKAILDALQHGGVLEDDCQVKILEALMLSPVSGGACSVKVETIRE